MLSALSPRERFRRQDSATWLSCLVVLLALMSWPSAAVRPAAAQAMAPHEGFGDLVEKIAPAVVNVSTRKGVAAGSAQPDTPMPQVPPGSPFEEFFKEFFDRDRSQPEQQRRSFSLGSGFVIDASGFVVTNNHVIADADEITVIFNDESEYPAKLIGTDTQDRSGSAQDRAAGTVPVRRVGGQRRGARRRLDGRDRQSIRPRLDGHGRDRLRTRPRHPRGALRRLLPDRRADQSRQFRRPQLHARRQGVRRQHRHLLAVRRQRRDRLRHSRQSGQAGHRQPDPLGQGRSWLARGAHPERDRRDRGRAGPATRPTGRWSPASRPADRRPRRTSSPAT